MRNTARVVVLLLLLQLLATNVALAADEFEPVLEDENARRYLLEVRELEGTMHSIRLRMTSLPPAEWLSWDISSYLHFVNWVVYNAFAAYVLEYGEVPTGLDVLVESKILSDYPGNPYRNWERVALLSPEQDFSPGDLVLQQPPVSDYSLTVRDGSIFLVPSSFELAVYGLERDVNLRLRTINEWAIIPQGAVSSLGFESLSAFDSVEHLIMLEEIKLESKLEEVSHDSK